MVSTVTNQDYYKVLGIEKNATADDIKRAYRKLAMKYHPDVNKEKDAEAMMKQVNVAYETLSDPKKREMYDRFGTQATQQQYQQQNRQAGPYGQTFYSFDDLLRAMFEQQQQQQRSRQYYGQQPPRKSSFFQSVVSFLFLMLAIRIWFGILLRF